jgi:hypothetical protein
LCRSLAATGLAVSSNGGDCKVWILNESEAVSERIPYRGDFYPSAHLRDGIKGDGTEFDQIFMGGRNITSAQQTQMRLERRDGLSSIRGPERSAGLIHIDNLCR